MSLSSRASKAELLSNDLRCGLQTTEALVSKVKKNIGRKAKRVTSGYTSTYSDPLFSYPIPFDALEFFNFCNDDLGMTLEEFPHMEICTDIAKLFPDIRFPVDQPKLFQLILLPRGTYKTTICAIALPIFLMWKNPNIRILISAHTHKAAKDRLTSIKKYLERNDHFIEKYGNWVPEFREEKWSETAIVITTRTQNLNDPTIDTCAVGINKDGSHPDVILGDDLQSKENVKTPGMRAKVWEHITSMSPMLVPGGTMLLIGTRKHNQDCYGKIYRINDALAAQNKPIMFAILKRGAILPDGSLYFPGRETHEFLATEKAFMGPKEFANEYLNEPIEEGAKMFTKDKFANMEKIEYFIDPLSGGGLIHVRDGQIPVYTTMVWDPAGHRPTESSDDHGITIVGNDPEDHWWVPCAVGVKGNPDYVVSRVAGFIMRYRPQLLGVETVFRQEMWVYLLRQHLSNAGIECPPIREIESKEAKYGRISALQPRVQNGGLTLDSSCMALREQMLDYPEVEHDDLIDSLASHIIISRASTPDDEKFMDEDDYFEDVFEAPDPRAKKGCYAGGSANSSRLAKV
jgi:predicted phage terminase large subunit-like protein